MPKGEKLVWIWVATIAALVILAELVLVDEGIIKTVLLVAAFGVIGLAYFKVRGDGKTLQPIKPHRKKSRGG